MVRKVMMYHSENEVMEKLVSALAQEGTDSCLVKDRKDLFKWLEQGSIHLIILEVKRKDEELFAQLELLSKIRKCSNVPVIVISEEERESVKIMMFRTGADDYILADCSLLEILARINSQLRRYAQLTCSHDDPGNIYQIGGLVIDDGYRKVMVNGRNVNLTPIEYKILKLLMQEQGKVISISQIYETIWHMKAVGVDNTVAVHIRHIREKIEKDPKKPQYLKVVWGAGYQVG